MRTFLRTEAPTEYTVDHTPPKDAMGLGDATYQAWRHRVAGKGWLAAHWPTEYAGAGMTTMEQFILKEEFALHYTPHPGGRAIEMVGPTVIMHGTDAQKRELLPPILRGEHIYCQGFSEPEAGSDLAAVNLRAVREGDEYVLNGQKIWTSNATTCNWMFFLARTDPDAPKHRGISYFVMPMDSEGLSVRTITDMAGGDELCEAFFDNVRVPASYRIGEENRGWYVAMTTLDFERSGIAGAVGLQQDILDFLRVARPLPPADPCREALAELYIGSEVARQMSFNIASQQERGLVPNYEASMAKLFSSELGQRFARVAVSTAGMRGMLQGEGTPHAFREGRLPNQLIRSLPRTIAGGSSEVQRGIIATRGLGLPRG